MASFSFPYCRDFIALFESLHNFVENVNLQLHTDNIEIQGIDACHICVINIIFDTEFFNSIEVSDTMILGVNVQSFNKIFKFAEKDDEITIKVAKDLSKMKIIMENASMFLLFKHILRCNI